jgi:copper chaperone CopZ
MERSATDERDTFESSDITGDGDRGKLETALGGLEGVRSVTVNPDAHTVSVVYDSAVLSASLLQTAIEDAGYKVNSQDDVPDPNDPSVGFGES